MELFQYFGFAFEQSAVIPGHHGMAKLMQRPVSRAHKSPPDWLS